MENKMDWIVWIITAIIALLCIVVIAVFYNLTKLQEDAREKYLKLESYRIERWEMTKKLAECIEKFPDVDKKYEETKNLFGRDYLILSKEEKSIYFQEMEGFLTKVRMEVKNHSSLQCEEKIRNICKRLNEETVMYHNAEMYYEHSVHCLNDKIDKVPEGYVARIFGIQKEPGLK